MNIILEGPDNSGKSTLAAHIAHVLNWPTVHSTGPASSPAAFDERARAFLGRDQVIFDRHCIVSERIYGAVRGQVMIDPDLEDLFRLSSKIVVYCRSTDELEGHVIKPHDTQEHLSLIARQRRQILHLYDQWALSTAHIIHRKGEATGRITRFILGELRR